MRRSDKNNRIQRTALQEISRRFWYNVLLDMLEGFQYTYSGLLSISDLTCDARACISHKTVVIHVAADDE